MSYRDPKTGEVYDDIKDALEHYCPAKDDRDVDACKRCAIGSSRNTDDTICTDFSVDHPAEAAHLMGYEVIDDVSHDSSGTCGICENSTPFGICGMVKCTKTDRYFPCEHKCDLKEDDMDKQDKPLSEWTLKEVQEMCDNQDDCPGCPFYTAENGCMFSGEAACWPLDEAGAVITPISDDIDALIKPDKPRLAKVLGVEAGEQFMVKSIGVRFFVDEDGIPKIFDGDSGLDVEGISIYYAINHPENIIRLPRLTEAELGRCRVYGAKYLARDKTSREVIMYEEKPDEVAEGSYGGGGYIGSVICRLFPSVRPGDCISVEEATTRKS